MYDHTNYPAFQAEFVDFRAIRSRSVVRITLEVPAEYANHALKVLGGVPDPGKSVWCAVTRMQEPERRPGTPEAGKPPSPPFHSLPLVQQAALRCQEGGFWKYLAETYGDKYGGPARNEQTAAEVVRTFCAVGSRSDLDRDPAGGSRWRHLDTNYRMWLQT